MSTLLNYIWLPFFPEILALRLPALQQHQLATANKLPLRVRGTGCGHGRWVGGLEALAQADQAIRQSSGGKFHRPWVGECLLRYMRAYIYTLSFQTLKICRVWIGNLGLPVLMRKSLGLCPKPWVSQETLWIQVRLSLDLGLMQLRWGGAGFKINLWKGWWAINNMSKATSIRQQTTNTIEPRVQNKQLLTLS